jgi:hypothetical protein
MIAISRIKFDSYIEKENVSENMDATTSYMFKFNKSLLGRTISSQGFSIDICTSENLDDKGYVVTAEYTYCKKKK